MLKLALCGDDCNACPRYIATRSGSLERLEEVATVWKRVGWRDAILPPEEMICHGCAPAKWCRYDDIRKCGQEKGVGNCGMCRNYPCEKIKKVFEQSESYARVCKEHCSKKDHECFLKAFFSKKENLDRVHEEYLSHER